MVSKLVGNVDINELANKVLDSKAAAAAVADCIGMNGDSRPETLTEIDEKSDSELPEQSNDDESDDSSFIEDELSSDTDSLSYDFLEENDGEPEVEEGDDGKPAATQIARYCDEDDYIDPEDYELAEVAASDDGSSHIPNSVVINNRNIKPGDSQSVSPSVISTTHCNITDTSSSTKTSGHRRHHYWFTVTEKIDIVNHYVSTGRLRDTARIYRINPYSLRYWYQNIERLHEVAKTNPKAKTCHNGRICTIKDMEYKIWQYVQRHIQEDLIVTTKSIIKKALSLDKNFKNRNPKKINRWVYVFLDRWKLSIRRITHKGQKLSGHLKSVRDETTAAINHRFNPQGSLAHITPHFFLNMDQTCIYFETKHLTSVTNKGARSVAARDSGSNARKCTVVITVASDGTKLPPFFVFKGAQKGPVANKVKELEIEMNILGTTQKKAWFDTNVAKEWVTKVLFPYVNNSRNGALLLIDHYSVHMTSAFADACNACGTDIEFVPPGYTCVLQPIDVGFNSTFKRHIRHLHQHWCIEKYANLPPDANVPQPEVKDIAEWVLLAHEQVKATSIVHTFKSIGYDIPGDLFRQEEIDATGDASEVLSEEKEGDITDQDLVLFQ